MKKTAIFLLAMLLLLQLCACGGGESVYCQSCDKKNSADASYCSNCGTTLEHVKAYNGGNNGGSSENGENYGGGTSSCNICAFDGLSSCKGHPCISCDGTGYIKCYGCVNGSTAYGPCVVCEGGKIDCTCDDGTRYYDRDEEFAPVDGTEFGGSSGYSGGYSGGESGYSGGESESGSCSKCDGGYVECGLCDGTGKFGSYTVGGFDGKGGTEVATTCSSCRGLKKVECSYCHGRG